MLSQLLKKANFKESVISGAVALLVDKKQSLDLSLRNLRISEYTAKLKAKDDDRDESFESVTGVNIEKFDVNY